jgi:hypothetical protein
VIASKATSVSGVPSLPARVLPNATITAKVTFA